MGGQVMELFHGLWGGGRGRGGRTGCWCVNAASAVHDVCRRGGPTPGELGCVHVKGHRGGSGGRARVCGHRGHRGGGDRYTLQQNPKTLQVYLKP